MTNQNRQFQLDALAYATQADHKDTLAHFRQDFVFAEPDLIYLDGNSLGRLPKRSQALAAELVEQHWGVRLIRGWNDGWFEAPERIGAKIARLIGAQPDEVIVADSTSVNLFKLAVAALRYQGSRTRILSDALNFPSDLYIFQGIIDLLGQQHQLNVLPSPDDIHGPAEEIMAAIDEHTALVSLSHVLFKSGYMYDMAAITAAAHAHGALALWDLSHSAGAVPVDLNDAGVDLAVGCTYKYLNGGPGAPAFLYVRRDLQEKLLNPISGWMGQKNLFNLDLLYQPAGGLRHLLSGTPPIVSLSLIEPGVELLLEAGIDNLRAKSLQQTEFFIHLWQGLLAPLGFTLNTPANPQQRGSHVSLGHPEGLRIDLALIHDKKVLPDFRRPNNIRLGIAPIYTSFGDIYQAVIKLQEVAEQRLYEKYSSQAPVVT